MNRKDILQKVCELLQAHYGFPATYSLDDAKIMMCFGEAYVNYGFTDPYVMFPVSVGNSTKYSGLREALELSLLIGKHIEERRNAK